MRPARPVPGVIFTDLDATLLDHDTYDFSPASDALAAARDASVPVVLCSSKTRAETLVWRTAMGLSDPFITENGGAVFCDGDDPLRECFPDRLDGMPANQLGTRYSVLRRALQDLRDAFGLALRGFGDMEPLEVARLTGLTPDEAALAKRRDFDEPFLWDSPPPEEQWEAVRRWLSERRLQVVRGGRLWHLVGGSDKGRAVRWLLGTYADLSGGSPASIALGDSENDLPMLEAVDKGVLVERPGGGHLAGAHPKIVRVSGIGPHGWCTAVMEWLAESHAARSGAPRDRWPRTPS